ncbi:MAG: signal transduction histidine kinase [Polyangiales bacterium]|jgi:signal transduction histidine kinase
MLSAAFLLALALLTWAFTTRIDGAYHERYARTTRRLQQLDARLNEEVAKCRLGIIAHYDGLVRVGDEIRIANHQLDDIPDFVDRSGRRLLTQRITEYRESLENEQAHIEQFKTEYAVLRNSLRALPHNAERVLSRLTHPADGPLRATVESLLRETLLVVVGASSVRHVESIRCDLVRLGMDQTSPCAEEVLDLQHLGPELINDVESVAQHVDIVLTRNAVTTGLIDDMMLEPVSSRAQQVRDTYAEIHQRAAHSARLRWLLVLGAVVVVMILGAMFIIVRLQTGARALRDTKAQLVVAMEELRVERDHEVELAALKSRFVSMTSHEFRTPLSVILSSTELIEAYGQTWDDTKRTTHLGRVRDAAMGMARMLDGVLLIGRAEAGMLELNAHAVLPSELAATVIEEVRSGVGAERHLRYSEVGIGEEMWLDDILLRHVLTNLLSNAFKYSPDDSTVRFSVHQDRDSVVFEVADDGIGIPPNELHELFQAFHRCSNASDIPGTGLGLAVVKKSVEAHRGTLEVEAMVGKGSRFSVRVPDLKEVA